MGWGKVTRALAGAAALVGLLGGAAWSAAPVGVGEDFERGLGEKAGSVRKETGYGPGWRAETGGDIKVGGPVEYLKYPAPGLVRPEAGTIEVEVVRDSAAGEYEALFALVDAAGDSFVVARVLWEGPKEQPGTTLEVVAGGRPLFFRTIRTRTTVSTTGRLGTPSVARGERAHFVMAWDGNGGALWLNGRQIAAEHAEPFGMAEQVADAVWLTVGAEPNRRGESYSQMHSVLKAFYVYDRAVDGGALYADPGAFRPSAVAVPGVASVEHDGQRVAGFSGRLVAGNTVGVTVRGEAGGTGSFDVAHYPDLGGKLEVDWSGWGVYLEDKTFYEPGEVNLRDVKEYAVYGATTPVDPAAPGMEPVARLKVGEQKYRFELLEADTPWYVTVVAEMKDGSSRAVVTPVARQPLTESEPGVYTGSWTVGYGDRYARAALVGRLEKNGVSAVGTAAQPLEVDPALTVSVATEPGELKADESSSAQVTVTVTDANGSAVSGHKVKFLLATTSQYTGVVGGGAFAQQVGGELKTDSWGETDLFGKVTATYVAGFAAKTAVIVARDMTSNDTGAGWVKTYIQSTAQLELEPVEETAAAAAGYEIAVTSSDEWLTADGQSQARITAKVTLNGEPVEGHAVGFDVSAGTGSVRVVKGTTGSDGEARAVYTAGTKIGMVLVTATDLTVGISGSVSIELRSDAPAKLKIRIEPEKLPADGHSRADLLVLVTDINDNPNDNVDVEYRIGEGGGRLAQERTRTDQRGESENTYTAGRSAGRVAIEITVRSTVPTEEELAAARSLALAVTDYDFF